MRSIMTRTVDNRERAQSLVIPRQILLASRHPVSGDLKRELHSATCPDVHARQNALASSFTPRTDGALMAMTNSMEPALEVLMEVARQAALNSYSPYSRFRVGAALKLSNGEIVTGTNVENVSYGLTICAERSALVRAVAQFGPGIRVDAVAVANLNDAASPPCGACRQVLAEFIAPDAPVIFPSTEGLRTLTFAELLPLSFQMKGK
jgi:cytidine deaminase